MRSFDYGRLEKKAWATDILNLVGKIHECKGRQELFIRQKPVELDRLIEIAKIQSTEASNKIEGIYTSDERLKKIVRDKTMPKTRSEQEIAGYRDVLVTIHENYDYIPVRPSSILQLHRDLYKYSGGNIGGNYKNSDNIIAEIDASGNKRTRFIPVAAWETAPSVENLCQEYDKAIQNHELDSLLLIPMFVLDFLCIHPFDDGNGRMSRLLTLLLLYKSNYIVGKYISIEKQIESTKDAYYDALQRADYGWHDEQNDPTPFIRYMLKVILACYTEFEERVGMMSTEGAKSTAYDMAKVYVSGKIGKFTSADVIAACPGAGRSALLAALKRLTEENVVVKMGSGRSTYYVRSDAFK